jgi:regulation of enolase protein 1 (concanavalin A-like superfamily)
MTGYHSTDGTNWTQQTSVTMSNLPASMVVGLGVTSDSTSNMATATFDHYDITVPNEPPTVNAGMDQTTSLPTATVTLAGNATDDNPASLTTTWSQLSGPGTTIFSDASSLTSDATFDTAGVYVLELSAGDGQFTDTDTMEVTVAEAQVAQWSGGDIGTVAVPGGFSTDEQAGTFTVSGSGEIKWWNFTDGCYFVSQQVTGDFTLTARVLSMSTNTWHGKAMVMARESHGSGSINFFESVGYSGGIRNYLRDETNGQYTTDQGPTGGAPYWVRIERSGNTLISSYSADGVAWTIHTSQTLSIGSSMEVGLAVTCDSGSSTGLTTATFDNVTLD